MELAEKKGLKEMFQDKKFVSVVAVALIVLGATIYSMLSGGSAETADAKTDSTGVNTTVPLANVDTSQHLGKLDLQSQLMADPTKEPTFERSSGRGMQGVPGNLDPYIYSKRAQASDAELAYVDTAIYERRVNYNPSRSANRSNPYRGNPYNAVAPYTPAPTTNRAEGSGLPGRLRPGNNTGSPTTEGMLSERDAMLSEGSSDDGGKDGDGGKPDPLELSRRQKELQDKQAQAKRLEQLLTEYRQDKLERMARETDNRIVRKADSPELVSSLNSEGSGSNSFYGLYTEDARKVQKRQLDGEVGAIRAMVYGDQAITNQGRVKIRLMEAVTVRGVTLPANTILYGQGTIANERVNIVVSSIQYENHLFPVTMTVFDMDGMAGIYVPNITGLQDLRQAAGQGTSGINVVTGGARNGLAAAGSAVVSAATNGVRQLTQRISQQNRAHLKSNYYVLLRSMPVSGGIGSTPSVQPTGLPTGSR